MRVRKGALDGMWAEDATSGGTGVGEDGRDRDEEGDEGDEKDGVVVGSEVWLTPRNASRAWMSELCAALGPESSVGRASSGCASRPSKVHVRVPESAPLNQGRISWQNASGSQ